MAFPPLPGLTEAQTLTFVLAIGLGVMGGGIAFAFYVLFKRRKASAEQPAPHSDLENRVDANASNLLEPPGGLSPVQVLFWEVRQAKHSLEVIEREMEASLLDDVPATSLVPQRPRVASRPQAKPQAANPPAPPSPARPPTQVGSFVQCTVHKVTLSTEREGKVRKHSQVEAHLKTQGPHFIVPLQVPAS